MRAWLVFLLVILAGCASGSESFLAIDLSTDHVAFIDFVSVSVSVTAEGAGVVNRVLPAEARDYVRPRRLVDFMDMPRGTYIIEIGLIAADGRLVSSRRFQVVSMGSYVLTARIDASCANIECPRLGDDRQNTECQDAACVPPSCLTPQECAQLQCQSDRDCGTIVSDCKEPVCVLGSCRFADVEGACLNTEYCDSQLGCSPRNIPGGDAGVDAGLDAQVDGLLPECGQPCDLAGPTCEAGVYDCSSGSPVCVLSGVLPQGTTCRAAEGPCDLAEVCDGSSGQCPLDAFEPVGTTCTGGFCDPNGMCSSGCTPGAACVPDGLPCRTGEIDCSSGTPSCVATGNLQNGDVCGMSTLGAWSACGGFSDTCDEGGTRTRDSTTFACQAGVCEPTTVVNREDCSRATAGTSCTTTCSTSGTCAASACAPPTETCNVRDDDCDGQCDEGANCRIGIHRAWANPPISAHFYTPNELVIPPGYELEVRNYFYLYLNPGPGLQPFYQCIKSDGKRFYTRNAACEGQTVERIIGYIATAPTCGATPLHRLYAGPTNNHFYASNEADRQTAENVAGFAYEVVAGYVWLTP